MTTSRADNETVSASGWLHFECELLADPDPVASIGLIVMAGDRWVDAEMRAFMPDEGVGIYVNRIPLPPTVSVEAAKAQAEEIVQIASSIIPDDRLDVLAYGTTGGTIAIGEDVVLDLLAQARPGVHHTTPVTAVMSALRAIDARRLALLTPYPAEINPLVADFFVGRGFEIAAAGGFYRDGDPEFVRVPPEAIRDAACELAKGAHVDALFVSCTALRVSPVLEEIELETGLPVISSTQALAWHCLHLAGYSDPLETRGVLLRTPPSPAH